MKLSRRLVVLSLSFVLTHGSLDAVTLITPEEAHKMITNEDETKRPFVLDTRGDYKAYISGHLPTARHLNFDTLRGTDDEGVPVQYLPDSLTIELPSRAGVQPDRTLILYADGGSGDDILSTTMVAYVLEKFGIQDVRILDGGLAGYKEKFALDQTYPKTPAGRVDTKGMNRGIGVDINYVVSKIKDKRTVFVDARPMNEYLGQDDVWPRKGHIPGAISFAWRGAVSENNTHQFRPASEMMEKFEQAGITKDKEIIVYCGTSREASLLRFYLAHLGNYPNVKVYEGSWKEYASRNDLPTETTPNRINN